MITNEHVFPDWLGKPNAKRHEKGRLGWHTTQSTWGEQTSFHQWQSQRGATMKAAKSTCLACNTVWLSRLDRQHKSVVEPMLMGVEDWTLQSHDQALLASFAYRVALFHDRCTDVDENGKKLVARSVIPTSFFRNYRTDDFPPADVQVYLGRLIAFEQWELITRPTLAYRDYTNRRATRPNVIVVGIIIDCIVLLVRISWSTQMPTEAMPPPQRLVPIWPPSPKPVPLHRNDVPFELLLHDWMENGIKISGNRMMKRLLHQGSVYKTSDDLTVHLMPWRWPVLPPGISRFH